MTHASPFLVRNRYWIGESSYLGGFWPIVTRKLMKETKFACADSFNLHRKFCVISVLWFPETKSQNSKDNNKLGSFTWNSHCYVNNNSSQSWSLSVKFGTEVGLVAMKNSDFKLGLCSHTWKWSKLIGQVMRPCNSMHFLIWFTEKR